MNDNPDISFLERACDSIAQSISDDCLVVNESTSYIGTLRNLIKPRIDRQSGRQGLRYAVAPERIDPGNEKWNLKNTPRVISGITINLITYVANNGRYAMPYLLLYLILQIREYSIKKELLAR